MRVIKDMTKISFGKLSDPGAVQASGLTERGVQLSDFTQESLSYVVKNIVEMYGLNSNTIGVTVVEDDVASVWADANGDGTMDPGEILLTFTMNAAINPYSRQSIYGKHFMYAMTKAYGYPIVFGVAAHEIGHFINHYTLCSFERRPTNQGEAIIQTTKVNDRWDELCADYQAGIIMAMASPRLDHTTLMNMMVGTHADSAHPDGFWRVMAIDMGYQWACAHSEMLNSRVITDDKSRCDLLSSFMKSFYEKVYKRVDPLTRASHSVLTNAFMEEVSYLIQYI